MFWHRRMLARHFEPGAAARYGMAPRKKMTLIKKARIHHHQNPLTFTGDSRRMLLRRATVGGTRHTARLRMRGPRYWHMYRKDYRQPEKAMEVLRVTPDEKRRLDKVADKLATRGLEKARGDVKTVRI